MNCGRGMEIRTLQKHALAEADKKACQEGISRQFIKAKGVLIRGLRILVPNGLLLALTLVIVALPQVTLKGTFNHILYSSSCN